MLEPGAAVRLELTKWGDRPHWRFPARYLGADAHGDWIGIPAGAVLTRPGLRIVTETDQVGLVPRPGLLGGGAWLATFHAPGYRVLTYVDMTSVPRWDGATLRAVDLDLDVVKTAAGVVYVDDEDEFAEHQRTLGYPPETIALTERSCAAVLAGVRADTAPFDAASAAPWFETLGGLIGGAVER